MSAPSPARRTTRARPAAPASRTGPRPSTAPRPAPRPAPAACRARRPARPPAHRPGHRHPGGRPVRVRTDHGGIGLTGHLPRALRVALGHPHPPVAVDGRGRMRPGRVRTGRLPEMAQDPGPVGGGDHGAVGGGPGPSPGGVGGRLVPVDRVRDGAAAALGADEVGPGHLRRRSVDPSGRPVDRSEDDHRAGSGRPGNFGNPHPQAAGHGNGACPQLHRLRHPVHGRRPHGARS